jgi:thioredoxin-like negative regulator of GroEL
MQNLTKQGFLTAVFDYESKKTWEYQGELPCLIEFHDDTCPPCQAVKPIIEQLAREFEGKVLFYRVDTPAEQELAGELGITNMPTLVLCPLGAKPVVFQGATSEAKLRSVIEQELLALP